MERRPFHPEGPPARRGGRGTGPGRGKMEAGPPFRTPVRGRPDLALPPDSPEGIVRFLASGLIDGIGPAYAERIVAAFGKDTFRVIEEESQRLEEVAGIGKSRRLRIKDSWKRQKSVRDLMIFLHAHGISHARALRLYKTYGQEAANILRADPYRLARDLRAWDSRPPTRSRARWARPPTRRNASPRASSTSSSRANATGIARSPGPSSSRRPRSSSKPRPRKWSSR